MFFMPEFIGKKNFYVSVADDKRMVLPLNA